VGGVTSIRVAVAGASGYMGAELLRLLLVHPRVTIVGVTSERLAGEAIGTVYPHLRGLSDVRFHELDPEWLAGVCDVAFLALPHMESQKAVPVLRKKGRKVIDLSADYRLHDAADYTTWYKTPHIDPTGLAEAVYGLPELHRKTIAAASLVASPGCYPVGAILATAPLLKSGLARLEGIVIDGKSGVSGAGAQGRKVVLDRRSASPHRGDGAGAVGARGRDGARVVHTAPAAAHARPLHHGLGAAGHLAAYGGPRERVPRVLRGRALRPRAR